MKNKLLYYIPYALHRDATFENATEQSFLRMFNAWISLSDRTNTLKIPSVIDIHNNSPMPTNTNPESFEACCHLRLREMIQQFIDSGKQKFIIMYSGGIDSTLILALFYASRWYQELKGRFYVAINEDSQIENPKFFFDIVLPYFGDCLIASNNFYEITSNVDNFVVTGECADNLFGSLTVKSYMDSIGKYDQLHEDWETGSLRWLLGKIPEKDQEQCEQWLYDLVNAAPAGVGIDTNHDFLWWINFTMKWQAVKYRMSMHAPTAEQAVAMAGNVFNFFDSEAFQSWALYTTEKKLGDTWQSYKIPAKKLLYEIWPNKEYLITKTKWPSLPSITRYNNAWCYLWETPEGKLVATKNLYELEETDQKSSELPEL
jgi:1,2-phenylacetyl-CoA epoxidase PaaB subunit